MMEDGAYVEIMGENTSDADYLKTVFDEESKSYFFPKTPDMQYDPGILSNPVSDSATAIAFLDSGMILEHPAIKSRLRHSTDFTGEGAEDLNGHGTLVSLISLSITPDVSFVNVKILDKHGRGKKSWLDKGLKWCAENAANYNIKVVNLSAGVYNKKWGLFDCKSNCSICNAARALSNAGVFLVAAAGNEGPDNLPCPQRVGLLEKTFMVVEAVDPLSKIRSSYSGKGNIGADELRYEKFTFKK